MFYFYIFDVPYIALLKTVTFATWAQQLPSLSDLIMYVF